MIRTKSPATSTCFHRNDVLYVILSELRNIRSDLSLLLPQEDVNDYAHPERIKRAFRQASKKYPPLSGVFLFSYTNDGNHFRN